MERFLFVSSFNLRPEIATLDDEYVPSKLFWKQELVGTNSAKPRKATV
jgi:hypothetical protein